MGIYNVCIDSQAVTAFVILGRSHEVIGRIPLLIHPRIYALFPTYADSSTLLTPLLGEAAPSTELDSSNDLVPMTYAFCPLKDIV